MGIITSRFREKLTTIEVLEKIDKDISSLQKHRRSNQELQKRIAARLLLYSILLYIGAVVAFYFFYFPDNWPDRALYSTPLLVFPFLIWGARKLMHWYFVKRLADNDFSLNELREKRKMILEDVMEKETYKKAREILEKFDPARFKKLEKPPSPVNPTPTSGTVMRQRVNVPQTSPMMATPHRLPGPMTPMPGVRSGLGPVTSPRGPMPAPRPGGPVPMRYSPPPGPPMPRTVISRDRGSMEKIIDYLVGDGPQNRFALICKFCSSHNGMALPEEFEYLSFRCCYCYNMNQARKMRPFAPRLEFPELSPQAKPPGAPGQVNGMPAEKEASSDFTNDEDDDDEEEEEEEEESLEKDGQRGDDQANATPRPSTSKVHTLRAVGSSTAQQKGAPPAVGAAQQRVAPTTGICPQQKGASPAQAADQQVKSAQAGAAMTQHATSPEAKVAALPQAASPARPTSQHKGTSQTDPAPISSQGDANSQQAGASSSATSLGAARSDADVSSSGQRLDSEQS